MGTPVHATADGEVTFAGWQNGYGRIVIVRHAFGLETRYPRLSVIKAEVGQSVARGDQVGDMGNSGRSTGPHLHHEVRMNGEAVDPMTFIRAGGERSEVSRAGRVASLTTLPRPSSTQLKQLRPHGVGAVWLADVAAWHCLPWCRPGLACG